MSKSERYRSLIIGRKDWWSLIKYEVVTLVCSWVPGVIGLFLRSKLYPLLLARTGRGAVFGANVVLRHPHKISLGDNVVIDDNCLLDAKGSGNQGIVIGNKAFIGRNSILSCKDGDILLADGVNVGFNCEIFSSSSVQIGENTVIAAYSYLIGGGNYDLYRLDVSFAEQEGMSSQGGILIGDSVWIGAGANVLDGVRIGSGSVVGAGAVVTRNIPDNSIAAGVPAKVLRSRTP